MRGIVFTLYFNFIQFLFCQEIAFAHGFVEQTITPIQNITEVSPSAKEEGVKRLKNARILIADYELIRRDFPQVAHFANPEIDAWLIRHTGFISIPQTNQETVNTFIPILEGEVSQAWRPPTYGRALVFEMRDSTHQRIGLIDAKGSGSLRPQQAHHGNGLATLGECIREYLYEGLIRRVLRDADVEFKTVGSYAVLDAGFSVIHKDGSTSPAGIYLRQAHTREGSLPYHEGRRISERFRNYGIEVAGNMQMASEHLGIYDFGHYVVKDDLNDLILEKAIPFHLWGHPKELKEGPGGWFYSKHDHPWRWSHELAEAFVEGRANRDHVWQHFQNLLRPVEEKLSLTRQTQSCQAAAMAIFSAQ